MATLRWTEEEVEKVKHLRFVERLSLNDIGKRFGVCRERVRQVLGNTGRYIVPNTQKRIEQDIHNFMLDRNALSEKIEKNKLTVAKYTIHSSYLPIVNQLYRRGFTFELVRQERFRHSLLLINHKHLVKMTVASHKAIPTSPRIVSPQYHFTFNKKPSGVDFYLLYIKPEDAIFVVPTSIVYQLRRLPTNRAVIWVIIICSLLVGLSLALRSHAVLDGFATWWQTPLNPPLNYNGQG